MRNVHRCQRGSWSANRAASLAASAAGLFVLSLQQDLPRGMLGLETRFLSTCSPTSSKTGLVFHATTELLVFSSENHTPDPSPLLEAGGGSFSGEGLRGLRSESGSHLQVLDPVPDGCATLAEFLHLSVPQILNCEKEVITTI